jgi:alpha-N-arabinofuranosidase
MGKETVQVTLHPDIRKHTISRYLYSSFAEHLGRCVYRGIWVGENSEIPNEGGIRTDTAEALKELALPALRWPGGCFADAYHWRDGVGPRQKRPRRQNLWWRQAESNEFGTDEFMRLCRMIGSDPYICLNVGTGTPEEAMSWVEYCNCGQDTETAAMRKANGHPEPYGVRFWGIGNENWGCGGGMRPEYYADLYRRFATFVRISSGEGSHLIACGSNEQIPEWDERFLDSLRPDCLSLVDSLALHIYTGMNQGISSTGITVPEYGRIIQGIEVMRKNLVRASALAEAYSSYGHSIGIALDEWGTWYSDATVGNGLYQQNTLADALFTAASFHCFHSLPRLTMTNMAQTVNVLQSFILTQGPRMVKTPAYYVYKMLRPHRDAILVPSDLQGPQLECIEDAGEEAVSVSASLQDNGKRLFVSLVNLDPEKDFSLQLKFSSDAAWKIGQAERLTAESLDLFNEFDAPERVVPQPIQFSEGSMRELTRLPARSITTVNFERVSFDE